MDEQRMAGFITGLKSVEEVEAGIFEVVVILQMPSRSRRSSPGLFRRHGRKAGWISRSTC
jgi:hypothetical protein